MEHEASEILNKISIFIQLAVFSIMTILRMTLFRYVLPEYLFPSIGAKNYIFH
jgi:hypothetical protein